jgi:hypothetical protein
MAFSAVAMASDMASRERGAAFRASVFNLAKTCSIVIAPLRRSGAWSMRAGASCFGTPRVAMRIERRLALQFLSHCLLAGLREALD